MPEFQPPVELDPFPIDEKELLSRYEKIFTAAVHDVLFDKHGIFPTLPSNLMPLKDGMKVCGIAFTVKGMPECRVPSEEPGRRVYERRAKMIEEMYSNSVVVWDSSHDVDNAMFGEMMTAVSMGRGSIGAVVDGGIRDTDRILETGYQIWSRYRSPASMHRRHEIIDWQVAVKIGEIIVNPGDVIFGDMDGIVVIPRGMAYEILIQSEEKQKTERSWRDIIATGVKPSDFVEEGGEL